jgi:hypothetical protein
VRSNPAVNPCAGSAPLSARIKVDVPAGMAALDNHSGVVCLESMCGEESVFVGHAQKILIEWGLPCGLVSLCRNREPRIA